VIRFSAVLLITLNQKYTLKERVFMGITWASKGSITAILGEVFISETISKGPKYAEY